MLRPEIRARYLRDATPVRLGGLAANLARVVSFSKKQEAAGAVSSLLEESRYFIEWSAPDLLPERMADVVWLIELGRKLTRWQVNWHTAQHDPAARAQLAAQAQIWSDEILKMSGLLTP